MSFTVQVGTDLVAVEAGATVPLTFEVANRSDQADRFEVSVEGLDPEWVAIPVPSFPVEAHDVHSDKLFLKPPRVSESLAGDYPFVVKVRSLESGESRASQAVLSVKAYHHLSVEVTPKKGIVSPYRKFNAFEATLMNLGNAEEALQLFASDPEDALTFEFAEEQVTLAPGQTKTVEFAPRPTKKRPFSSSRLHGFSVGARSTSAPSVVCSAQAQLEERALMSPGSLLFLIVVGLLFFGWFRLLPKPPSVDSLSLDPVNPVRGSLVRVTWRSSNATGVRILVNGQPLVDGPELEGSRTFIAESSGTVEATAYRDNKASTVISRSFNVTIPPEIPDPEILSFDIQPRSLKLGQSFLVKYKVGPSVVKATLSPTGDVLDPKLDQRTLTANLVGEIEYELVAENAAQPPKIARKTIKVSVIEASKAAIIVFKAEPVSLPVGGGWVTVAWQVQNAVRIELSDAKLTQVLDGDSGEKEVFIDASADLVLSAFDDRGLIVTRKVRIEVANAPPPDGATASGAGGGGP
jgi:hypothetical protein